MKYFLASFLLLLTGCGSAPVAANNDEVLKAIQAVTTAQHSDASAILSKIDSIKIDPPISQLHATVSQCTVLLKKGGTTMSGCTLSGYTVPFSDPSAKLHYLNETL